MQFLLIAHDGDDDEALNRRLRPPEVRLGLLFNVDHVVTV